MIADLRVGGNAPAELKKISLRRIPGCPVRAKDGLT
jgi:hypothetical protein